VCKRESGKKNASCERVRERGGQREMKGLFVCLFVKKTGGAGACASAFACACVRERDSRRKWTQSGFAFDGNWEWRMK